MDKSTILKLLTKDNLVQPKVLLIEDCQFDTVFLKRTLEQYYPLSLIDYANTKFTALQKLKKNMYDIVLLDLHLPDSVGSCDIKDFKHLCPNTPLIVVTGFFNNDKLIKARQYGADGMISKSDLMNDSFEHAVSEAIDNIEAIAS